MPANASLWLMVLLAAIVAITPFAVDTYLPAMPVIAKDLHTHIGIVQQSLSIFLAAYGAGMLVFGPLADKLGRRPLALFGVSGFAISTLFIALTTTIEGFLIGRALQAFCGAAATVIVPGIIRHLYQEHTAKGMSLMSLIMMLAPLLAPAIGSGILMVSQWQTIFWLIFSYAILMLFFIWKYLPEFKNPVAPSKITFLSSYVTVFANADARPLILTAMFSSFSFFCYLTAVPFVYIEYFGISAQLFSFLFAVNILLLMLSSFINSRFVTRVGSPRMARYALIAAFVLAILLCIVNIMHLNIWFTVLALAPLMGCLTMITTNTDAMIILKFPNHSGTASAVTGTLRYGCGALAGPALALSFTGTAVPFSVLMFAGILGMGACQIWIARRKQAKPLT